MKKKNQKSLCAAVCCLAAFVLWTLLVLTVDVQSIGPTGSAVGFATLNGWFHELTGVHMGLYNLTDRLSLIPVAAVMGFGLLGLWQWIKRKSIWSVDRGILVLGGYYIAVLAFYVLFEMIEINFRPVLIQGILEASYPSSTTLLVLTVMPVSAKEACRRVKNSRWILYCSCGFTGFMVIARLLSGVHWITDIIGGVLLSGTLVLLYSAFSEE